MNQHLRVNYYSKRVPEITTIGAVLRWKEWSDREKEALQKVADGEMHRFMTVRNGEACGIERGRRRDHHSP